MPQDELVATSSAKTKSELSLEQQVAVALGADRVVYQDLPDLLRSVTDEAEACGCPIARLDSSCFDGNYVTSAAVGTAYLANLAATRTSDRGNESSTVHLLDRLEIPAKKARGS